LRAVARLTDSFTQFLNLFTQGNCPFKVETFCCIPHLLFELDDHIGNFCAGDMPGILDIDLFFLHGFPDGLWDDVMLGIVQDLQIPAPFCLCDRPFHRICHDVGIQHYLCIDVPCSTPDDLDQAPCVAEEHFLIRIEDTDEPDFGDVKSLPKEIDTDKHIELPEPELPNDLAAFEGLALRMKVSCPYALACEKLGKFC